MTASCDLTIVFWLYVAFAGVANSETRHPAEMEALLGNARTASIDCDYAPTMILTMRKFPLSAAYIAPD